MLHTVTVAAAVLNQTPLDWDGNQRRIMDTLRAARAANVGLVCLPELCLTGYGCEDAFHGPDVIRQSERLLRELLPETAGMVACVGLPRLHHRALLNTVAVAADGRLVGFVAKRHLAGDGIHYEPRWFKPWPDGHRAETVLDGRAYPLGDLLFDLGGVRFGFEICEDAWVADRPGARLAAFGADLILNPSASHFAFGKLAVRRGFVAEGSRAFGAAYVYANLLGNEAGRAIYDGGALIAADGRIIAQGPRLGLEEWSLTTATVDLGSARLAQTRSASFRPAIGEHPGLVHHDHRWPAAGMPTAAGAPLAPWETSPHLKEEEFTRAVTLGLFDYQRKSRTRGYVVSLSGGADSAAVAALVALAVRRALTELGWTGLCHRLPYLADHFQFGTDPGGPPAEAVVGALLTTIWQGTANSSADTAATAAAVAAALGARHLSFDVDHLVMAYRAMVGKALGRELTWDHDDIALQNIQARARAPGAWMVANLEDALLLATSNRSEAAVGYATMDGDTCGSLSPIAGIDKAFLRRWLAWLADHGPHGLGALPVLHRIISQRSTPELRPPTAAQRSEDDLMPFPVLDRIERLAIRDKLPPADVLPRLAADFPDLPRAQLQTWVARFFTLWCRNQWKRERFAPAFHLDDENLDPKTWCRFPILSGGFRRELKELEHG
jgi:NAD+ synthase (glutamine-hydrolysing)